LTTTGFLFRKSSIFIGNHKVSGGYPFKSIDSRIVKSLIESGLILKDIINLTEEELERFDGIGKTKAKKLRLNLVCKRFWIN
jgi:hypothetical protein